MKKWRKLLGILMSGVVLLTGGVLPQNNAAAAEGVIDYGVSSPRTEDGVTTWDKIKFGSYYQDAEIQPAEPIKWRVLSVNGNDAFLLADKNLDVKLYNEEMLEEVTWETCTLRKWLNEDFYNEAFDDDEKKAVAETITKDKVYLLSAAEVCNRAYGFDTETGIEEGSETRQAEDTDYAKAKGSSSGTWGNTFNTTNGYWWLRSPGAYSGRASIVHYNGYCDYDGYNVNISGNSVRPALHVNLSSPKVKAAGKVDSKGNVTMSGGRINNPIVKDGVTTWDCVYFGNYRQNFSVRQDIEWRILSVNGDDAFLLADKSLDCEQYNKEYSYVTWETCTIRKWLNEDFYNEAFDDEEKDAVRETTVDNKYGTEGGNDTKDKVYLLSITEVSNGAYGFTEFIKASKTREVKNTGYARANGAWYDDDGTWWLRTSDNHGNNFGQTIAAFVQTDGVGCMGEGVDANWYGVRPALHINLSSSSWSKAGQVTADNEPEAPPEPTEKPTDKPTASPGPEPTTTPTVTAQPTPPSVETPNPVQTAAPVLKQLKLSSVKCAKNAKKITGKVSVSKASVKIKVGKKAYKKAAVKGKKFTLKLNYKLKKKTKVIIKAEKKGYKSLVKSYTVK